MGNRDRRWESDPRYEMAEGKIGPLEQSVGRELAQLGWREDLSSAFGTLGWQALSVAENIDGAAGGSAYYVPGLNKELRETMTEARRAVETAADAGKVDQDGQPVKAAPSIDDYRARREQRRPPPAAEG